jgi:MoxR-like ATPase
MPTIRDIKYKRAMVFNGEIANKILFKDEVNAAKSHFSKLLYRELSKGSKSR